VGAEERRDRFRELEEAYRDYTVYDQHYEKVGRVDDLFVDEDDRPEYIGVKTGFLGMKSTLIPMELARINDRRKLIEVAADKGTIQSGPAFDDDEEITPEHEARIYGYYGLEHPGSREESGGYGDYYESGTTTEPSTDEDLAGSVDTEYGERREEPPARPAEETSSGEADQGYPDTAAEDTEQRDDLGETDEPPRSEEGQQAGTGEREAGSLRVFKRVRTDR
jgi:PRC-barrel domain